MNEIINYSADIETGPQSESEVLRISGPFNPSKVKLGNLKDADKIAAKIEAERASYLADCIEAAPLSPLTGRVEAIGYKDDFGRFEAIAGDERDVLTDYWNRWSIVNHTGGQIYGWNFFGFDANFIWTRSMVLGVKVPAGARRRSANGFASFPSVTDLMVEFTGAPNEYAKLDNVARAFGHSGKNGDGAMFWRLFRETATRAQALDYLANDLDMTHVVRVGLGFLSSNATADCPADYLAV